MVEDETYSRAETGPRMVLVPVIGSPGRVMPSPVASLACAAGAGGAAGASVLAGQRPVAGVAAGGAAVRLADRQLDTRLAGPVPGPAFEVVIEETLRPR